MVATLNTALVQIPWTNIITSGVDRDVISWTEDSLSLFMGLNLDLSLFGHGYDFTANFRIIEVETDHIFNHYWDGKLDSLPHASGLWLSMTWPKAVWAGVSKSRSPFFSSANYGDGLYLYRPYFLVFVGEFDSEFIIYSGKSEFAVSEEHYFLAESS